MNITARKSIKTFVIAIIILLSNSTITNESFATYNELQYVYSVDGLLMEVNDGNGKILYTFEYDENCNLVQIIKQI